MLYPVMSNRLQTVTIVPIPASQMPILNLEDKSDPMIPVNTATTPSRNAPKITGISIRLEKYLYFSNETIPVDAFTAYPLEKRVQITKIRKNTTNGMALYHRYFLDRT